jgi:rhodanese-related sulfurtransferase
MKNILFLFSIVACTFSCNQSQLDAQTKADPAAFELKIKEVGAQQLIDVRTPQEFQSGHIKGAVNYNINGADFQQNIAKLDKNKPVLVYCAVGGRSGNAAQQLNQLGFKQVTDLKGGITAWKSAGKAVE